MSSQPPHTLKNAPFIPDDAPFNIDQRAWINGYLTGLQSRLFDIEAAAGASDGAAQSLNILFGTQTGNAEQVAEEAAELADNSGFAPQVAALDEVSMEALTAMERLVVIVSTYGEGEMPDNAELFWDALSATTAPRLEQLRYAVLALGDTSYEHFCHAGKLIDTRMEQLGAQRLAARIDCDVDFEDSATEWLNNTLPLADDRDVKTPVAPSPTKSKEASWTRKNPFPSKVIENRLLSGEDSDKEIRHFAFDLGDSGIEYEAGDALGVMPVNHTSLVGALIDRLGAEVDDPVEGFDDSLANVLTHQLEIMTPSRDVITQIEQRAKHDEFSHVVRNGDKEALESFLWGRDTLDLLHMVPEGKVDPAEFVSWLRPLQHRAYSISSSPKAHPGEVHLTVAAVRWRFAKREHRGVASTWLADCTDADDTAGIFVSRNKSFRVPEDNDAPVIMVGPGTGIAPFRAFLEERRERGARGKNWLFFGDQHRHCDFIYEEELSALSEDSVLSRLDLAFSRDQSDKIYVQHRMLRHAEALFRWLEDGGYFYVCGDATRMAKDVDAALLQVIESAGGLDNDAAIEYVNTLKREKRYLRDVY
ncbi:MAG: sulfite reductase subunit alpha [Pseudomonadota bacterium]